MLVGERPLAQAVKSFERADPVMFPFISPESKFDPGNLIGRLKKRLKVKSDHRSKFSNLSNWKEEA